MNTPTQDAKIWRAVAADLNAIADEGIEGEDGERRLLAVLDRAMQVQAFSREQQGAYGAIMYLQRGAGSPAGRAQTWHDLPTGLRRNAGLPDVRYVTMKDIHTHLPEIARAVARAINERADAREVCGHW